MAPSPYTTYSNLSTLDTYYITEVKHQYELAVSEHLAQQNDKLYWFYCVKGNTVTGFRLSMLEPDTIHPVPHAQFDFRAHRNSGNKIIYIYHELRSIDNNRCLNVI